MDWDTKRAEREAADKLQQDLNHAEGMIIGHLNRQPSPDVDSVPPPTMAPPPTTPTARSNNRGLSPLDAVLIDLIRGPAPKTDKVHSVSPDETALNLFFASHDCAFLAEKARISNDGQSNVVSLLEEATPAVIISIFCMPGKDADYFKRELMEMGFSGTDARKLFIALRNIRDGI
jgi:hypothetical protein